MSTRYLKKDNVVLVGIAKNGSQAIKQIGINNNGFEIREQQGEWNQDNFIDFDDEYRSPGWDRFKKNKMLKWKK